MSDLLLLAALFAGMGFGTLYWALFTGHSCKKQRKEKSK